MNFNRKNSRVNVLVGIVSKKSSIAFSSSPFGSVAFKYSFYLSLFTNKIFLPFQSMKFAFLFGTWYLLFPLSFYLAGAFHPFCNHSIS